MADTPHPRRRERKGRVRVRFWKRRDEPTRRERRAIEREAERNDVPPLYDPPSRWTPAPRTYVDGMPERRGWRDLMLPRQREGGLRPDTDGAPRPEFYAQLPGLRRFSPAYGWYDADEFPLREYLDCETGQMVYPAGFPLVDYGRDDEEEEW